MLCCEILNLWLGIQHVTLKCQISIDSAPSLSRQKLFTITLCKSCFRWRRCSIFQKYISSKCASSLWEKTTNRACMGIPTQFLFDGFYVLNKYQWFWMNHFAMNAAFLIWFISTFSTVFLSMRQRREATEKKLHRLDIEWESLMIVSCFWIIFFLFLFWTAFGKCECNCCSMREMK